MMVGHFLTFIQSSNWSGGPCPVLKRRTLLWAVWRPQACGGEDAITARCCPLEVSGCIGGPKRSGLFRRLHLPPPVVWAGRGARPGEP